MANEEPDTKHARELHRQEQVCMGGGPEAGGPEAGSNDDMDAADKTGRRFGPAAEAQQLRDERQASLRHAWLGDMLPRRTPQIPIPSPEAAQSSGGLFSAVSALLRTTASHSFSNPLLPRQSQSPTPAATTTTVSLSQHAEAPAPVPASPTAKPYIFSSLQLPLEVSNSIFARLSAPKDLGNAFLVCKHWAAHVPVAITSLDLSLHNMLSVETVSNLLPRFPSLTTLILPPAFTDQVTDELMLAIARHCPRLTSLHASGHILSRFCFTPSAITALLDACPRLHHLALGTTIATDLAPAAALWLPPAPPRPALRSLTLHSCLLPHPHDIPLGHLTRLTQLSLVECSFSKQPAQSAQPAVPAGEGAGEQRSLVEAVFAMLGQVTSLTSLHLAAYSLCVAVSMPGLRGADAENDGVSIGGEQWLGRLTSLRALESLTLCGILWTSRLPRSWQQGLPALRSLRLLQMEDLADLQVLFRMTQLRELAISHARLSTLPHALSALSNLQRLAFTHSFDLRTVTPGALSALVQLKELDLSGNRLLSRLPPSLSDLRRLQILRLVRCPSVGDLPSCVRELPALCLVDLSGCSAATMESAQGVGLPMRHNLTLVSPEQPPSMPTFSSPIDASLQLHPYLRDERAGELMSWGELVSQLGDEEDEDEEWDDDLLEAELGWEEDGWMDEEVEDPLDDMEEAEWAVDDFFDDFLGDDASDELEMLDPGFVGFTE